MNNTLQIGQINSKGQYTFTDASHGRTLQGSYETISIGLLGLSMPAFIYQKTQGHESEPIVEYNKYYYFSCKAIRTVPAKTTAPSAVITMSLLKQETGTNKSQSQIVKRFFLPEVNNSNNNESVDETYTLECTIEPNDSYNKIVFTRNISNQSELTYGNITPDKLNDIYFPDSNFGTNDAPILNTFKNLIPADILKLKSLDISSPTEDLLVCINGEGIKVRNFILNDFDISFLGIRPSSGSLLGNQTITYYY